MSRDNYIEERLGTPITREFQHSFKEISSFTEESQTTNRLVTHGRVRESDAGSGGNDDTIGDYEGYSIVPHLLLESKTQRFQQDSDDYVDLTFKITPVVSTRRMHEYILNGSIYIFRANDAGSNYEPYGYLNVDIGNKVGNQRRQMWYVSQSDHLSVPNKHGYTVQLKDQYFTEAVDFMESGQTDVKVYLHGYVKEDDAGDLDDDIGRFEGASYNPHELENGKKQRFYGREDGSYIDVYLKMYDLSKHKSTAVIKKKVKVVRKNVEL